ncbi:hypothetical protein FD755_010343 [Muntiacus reevesi]|uniref:40S ribosomal protein S25 n=1 Tax=Muntiacus reevesi TaxID=9886 RepID=A0A5N3XZA7_MUNRE|nr:hypothetical protein FD755_010343 [Muntiacus reevesi]
MGCSCSPSFTMLPKDKKKKHAGNLINKDKDPVKKSGGKVWDKLNNLVLFDKANMTKLCKEVPNYKFITPDVSERLKIELLIKLVSKHRVQVIYARNTKGGDAPAASEDARTGPTNVTFWGKKKEKTLLNKKITHKKLPFFPQRH